MPNTGATNVPKYCSEPNNVSRNTEPVSTSTYQPRIKFSISVPQDVSMSAGYWKRKLRTWNGANSEDGHIAAPRLLIVCQALFSFLDGLKATTRKLSATAR